MIPLWWMKISIFGIEYLNIEYYKSYSDSEWKTAQSERIPMNINSNSEINALMNAIYSWVY